MILIVLDKVNNYQKKKIIAKDYWRLLGQKIINPDARDNLDQIFGNKTKDQTMNELNASQIWGNMKEINYLKFFNEKEKMKIKNEERHTKENWNYLESEFISYKLIDPKDDIEKDDLEKLRKTKSQLEKLKEISDRLKLKANSIGANSYIFNVKKL